jgi:hypothetical protein
MRIAKARIENKTEISEVNPFASPKKRNNREIAISNGDNAAGNRKLVDNGLSRCLRQLLHDSWILISLSDSDARTRSVLATFSSSSSRLLAFDQMGPAGGVHHPGFPLRK